MNVGHGHVFPREDGVKARCGGPAICALCAFDLAKKTGVNTNAQQGDLATVDRLIAEEILRDEVRRLGT